MFPTINPTLTRIRSRVFPPRSSGSPEGRPPLETFVASSGSAPGEKKESASPLHPGQAAAAAVGGAAGAVLQAVVGKALRPEDFGLPLGKRPQVEPELILTDRTAAEIARERATPDTLIVTDDFNLPQLKGVPGKIVVIHDTTAGDIHAITDQPDFSTFHTVLGVGGCAALDIAKAVGVDKEEVVIVPTLLSTNCITKNRSVINHGLGAFSYRTAAPSEVIVSIHDLEQMDPAVHRHWSAAGFGDFFAKLSAMIDQEWEQGRLATPERMQQMDSEVMGALDWVNGSFHGYDRPCLEKLAHLAHDAGIKVIRSDRNDVSVGGEHIFYKTFLDLYPEMRQPVPHGTLVAIGTLVATRILAEESGDFGLYQATRGAFEKLGLPTSYRDLEELGIKRDMVGASLQRMSAPDIHPSYLGSYFRTHSWELLDRVFDA